MTNLLVTNTQEEQAYLLLRCLVSDVDRIIVTICGDSVLKRWACEAAWSRHVSRRYRVPDCSGSWRSGIIQPENTAGEELYIQRLEEICAAESIDVIFPSYDAEVYVLSKNQQRLAALGIATVVPDYESLIPMIDKSLTLQAAREVGFPMPKTQVLANHAQIKDVIDEIDPPWIVKPRCSAHGATIINAEGAGMAVATDREELEAAVRQLSKVQERPIVQEYVPYSLKRNFYMVVNREFEVISMFSPQVLRTRKGKVNRPCAAVVSTLEIPYADEVRALVREMRIWGVMTLQTLVDERDGKLKLLEVNARFGHNIWFTTELGVNEPLMALRLAKGEDPGEVPVVPEGVIMLDPMLDFQHLISKAVGRSIAWIRKRLKGVESDNDRLEKEYFEQLLRDLRSEYFTRRKRITNPSNRGFLTDPGPPTVRSIKMFANALRSLLG